MSRGRMQECVLQERRIASNPFRYLRAVLELIVRELAVAISDLCKRFIVIGHVLRLSPHKARWLPQSCARSHWKRMIERVYTGAKQPSLSSARCNKSDFTSAPQLHAYGTVLHVIQSMLSLAIVHSHLQIAELHLDIDARHR